MLRSAALVMVLAVAACGPPAHRTAAVTNTPPCGSSAALGPVVGAPGPPADGGAASTALGAPPSASARAAPGEAATAPDRRRFYPGADDTSEPHARKKTAVLLFAPPDERLAAPEEDLAEAAPETVRLIVFEPVLCVLNGKLAAGLRCAEAMPAKATVRLTGGGTMDVQRRTTPFKDTNGSRTFAAPYAPSCCMYNTCVGRTIPYAPADDGVAATHTHRTVLAVWPKDAEIELIPESADRFDASKKATWQRAGGSPGAREYLPIATTDLDGDGKREVVVYERWANDYALFVVPREGDPPLLRFSCGNI